MDLKDITSGLNQHADETGLVFTIEKRDGKDSIIAKLDSPNLYNLIRSSADIANKMIGPIGLSLDPDSGELRITRPSAVTQDQIDIFNKNAAAIAIGVKTGDPKKVQAVLDNMNKHYGGDFNHDGLDSGKHKGKLFIDGDYRLPPTLKAAALKNADELMALESPAGITRLLPGVDMNGNGQPSREEIASYLLAQSMDTNKPGPFFVGPGSHSKVESKFTNDMDTRRISEEIRLVATQIYGDNFDPSMKTDTPAADAAFTSRMDSSLPTPKC